MGLHQYGIVSGKVRQIEDLVPGTVFVAVQVKGKAVKDLHIYIRMRFLEFGNRVQRHADQFPVPVRRKKRDFDSVLLHI